MAIQIYTQGNRKFLGYYSGSTLHCTINTAMQFVKFKVNNEQHYAVIGFVMMGDAINKKTSFTAQLLDTTVDLTKSYNIGRDTQQFEVFVIDGWVNTTSTSTFHVYNWSTHRDMLIKQLYPAATDIDNCLFEDIIQDLFNRYTSFHTDPVYADATQINYSDGSYEVIRGRMTEDDVKNHAYNTLLTTYGTFYKATETEVSEYYKKQVNP